MFKTIAWATDGSEHSDATLALVTELADLHGSKIVALHVNERFRGGRFGGGPVRADEDELQRKIESQVATLKEAGYVVELDLITTGAKDTAASIADAAEAANADLIVVGTHGYGDIESLLMPSVARGLTHHTHCPVLVVPVVPVPVGAAR